MDNENNNISNVEPSSLNLKRKRGKQHGMNGTPTHRAWTSMRYRMMNPKNPKYENYAGRGLELDPYYLEFLNFFNDLGEKPNGKYSLGRIDNDLGYIRGNLRWETDIQQANNKRNNTRISFNDKELTIPQWSRETGLGRGTIFSRIHREGWTIEKALTTPVQPPTVRNLTSYRPKLDNSVEPPPCPSKKSDD